jgi:lipid-A-disaccharide synthase
LYAGALTRELQALSPGIVVRGLGGPQFESAGGVLIDDYRGLTATGLTESIATLPKFRRTIQRLAEVARADRPDALVVIDFPEFNLRLASRVKRLGIPIIYYISPQIWAWRAGRMNTIRKVVDRVLVIFPFEEAIYRDAHVPVEFVGHPLIDLAKPSATKESFLQRLGLVPGAPTVAILPGSRHNEVSRIFPVLLSAAGLIQSRVPQAQFVVARAPLLDNQLFAGAAPAGVSRLAIVEGETDTALAAADVALTASGTATVQTALHDVPMVVVYRLSPITYRLVRPLVKLDSIAMVNLIAGERIVPELLQNDLTPEAVAREAVSMLTDESRRQRIRTGLARVREKLGGPGASRRAAQAILSVIQHHHAS